MTDKTPTEPNPSIMSHVSIGTNRMSEACAFYDAVLASIDARRVMDFPSAVAYGREFPEFWVHPPHNGQPASVGNGSHFGFMARNRDEVNRFYQTAVQQGATCEGEPGPRPQYGDAYYGCFLRDLDGNKIEAMFWDTTLNSIHPG